jgi:hypothetical protein
VVDTVLPVVDPVVDTVLPVVDPVTETLDPVIDTVLPVVDPVVETLDPVVDTVAPALDPVTAATAPVLDAVAPQAGTPPTDPIFGAPEAATPIAGAAPTIIDAPAQRAAGPAASYEPAALGEGRSESLGSGSWLPSIAQAQPLSQTFTAPPAADPSPQDQVPGSPSGSSFTAPAGGAISGALYALLIALSVLALYQFGRLQLAPARWRSATFIALLERPG